MFFKQKTAYEMRISDWSSDVCSSDLLWPLPLDDDRLPVPGPGRSAIGSGSPEPAATPVSIAALLRRPPPGLEKVPPGTTPPVPRRVPGPPASPSTAGPGLPVPTVQPGPAGAVSGSPAEISPAPNSPAPIPAAAGRPAPPVHGLPDGPGPALPPPPPPPRQLRE